MSKHSAFVGSIPHGVVFFVIIWMSLSAFFPPNFLLKSCFENLFIVLSSFYIVSEAVYMYNDDLGFGSTGLTAPVSKPSSDLNQTQTLDPGPGLGSVKVQDLLMVWLARFSCGISDPQ